MRKIQGSTMDDFLRRDSLYSRALKLWEEAIVEEWEINIPEVSTVKKQENERAIHSLTLEMEEAKTKEQLKTIVKDFLLEGRIFSFRGRDILMDPGFFKSSEEFLEKVQKYDPNLSLEDTGQALRNLWIMNLLQKAFEVPVTCTNGAFGYSMLYPYTDNFMDDPKVDKKEKHMACERLNRRLSGIKEDPRGNQEKKIFHMIEKIEDSFPRETYPGVFHSLLYIHYSQWESLKQHRENLNEKNKNKIVEEKELLKTSFHKGGASVLADGYLVKGNLHSWEKQFCFNYGVILQLADDLQDCKEDYSNRHQTLFSMDYSRELLDEKVRRLIVFSNKVFGDFYGNRKVMEIQGFLLEHTLWLILGSVLKNPDCFSREFLQWAEARFPLTPGFLEAQAELVKKKVKNPGLRMMKESGKLW